MSDEQMSRAFDRIEHMVMRHELTAMQTFSAMKQAARAQSDEPVAIDDDMAFAFAYAIGDGHVGNSEVEEIKMGLKAALANVTHPTAREQMPEGWRERMIVIRSLIANAPEDALGTGESHDCPPWPIRDEVVDQITKLLAAAPQPQPDWTKAEFDEQWAQRPEPPEES